MDAKFDQEFDVVVVGAGHAGCEAAHAAARTGARTLLVTQNLDTIGQMSCNPAIGGLGKGHLVREIDALGGVMGVVADRTAIQFRLLNRRKGPSVRGPRAQIDKASYRREMRRQLETLPRLTIRQAEVVGILHQGRRIHGIRTDWGERYGCASLILTTGTFLRGLVHQGERIFPAGRLGDPPARALGEAIEALGLRMGRMKTGTPPRLDGRTIAWEVLERQEGDQPPVPFSFLHRHLQVDQLACHITHTTSQTHRIIGENLQRAPLYSGQIQSMGPRYCPSIEDKVVRFAQRDSHQLFLEPEGRDTREIYPNGISTSLPVDVQWALVRTIPGLERAELLRPGYAIEYDMVDPRQLGHGLAVQDWEGLFLAGQINGTTGYEEAAGQGLLAGINGARFARGEDPVTLSRRSSYLGVMVDDLVLKGVEEPYRLFTSRAEFRLALRIDNADQRLTPWGREWGLVEDDRWDSFRRKQAALERLRERLREQKVFVAALSGRPSPEGEETHQEEPAPPPGGRISGWEALKRWDLSQEEIGRACGVQADELEILEQLWVDAQYEGYLRRQDEEVERLVRSERVVLPVEWDWNSVVGLSNELRQRLGAVRPATLGQAQRVSGMTPAGLSAILVHLKRMGGQRGG